MTTRRNPLDNDLLADLGIGTTSACADSTTGDRAPAATPAASAGPAMAPGTNKTKRIGVDVSEEVWIATKVVAAQRGTTVTNLIRSHLAQLIAEQARASTPHRSTLGRHPASLK
ncbi:MAG: hypothetical protein KAZ88_11420 [Acidimicrobiia bacterium]|nr:hypothetical protein [Acidimicrobiia bacterium]MBP8181589.1 hypothetical protein [Acidimicrobiia bacterium]